jgi:hypothetical protein
MNVYQNQLVAKFQNSVYFMCFALPENELNWANLKASGSVIDLLALGR